jgi:calcium binding protein
VGMSPKCEPVCNRKVGHSRHKKHDMFILIRWKRRQLAVPLMQVEGIQVDEETQQAIEDWHYWVNRGYKL